MRERKGGRGRGRQEGRKRERERFMLFLRHGLTLWGRRALNLEVYHLRTEFCLYWVAVTYMPLIRRKDQVST